MPAVKTSLFCVRHWKKWVSLSSRVSKESLQRLQPKTGTVCAVTQVGHLIYTYYQQRLLLPDHVILKVASGGKVDGGTVETDPEARINFTNITRDRYYLSL